MVETLRVEHVENWPRAPFLGLTIHQAVWLAREVF